MAAPSAPEQTQPAIDTVVVAEAEPSSPQDIGRPPVVASNLLAACEATWRAIQVRHPEVPDAVMVLGSGVERGRLVKLGHWWGAQWSVGAEARAEVLVAGEALHLPAEEVCGVLLHEAAHGLNAGRCIKDTSRGGRYHNNNFRDAAKELGLRPRRMNPYGWARTELTPATTEIYADAIAGLRAEMRLARNAGLGRQGGVEEGDGRHAGDEGDGGGASGPRRNRAAECGCEPPRKLRMAPSVLDKGPVICGLCEQDFAQPAQAEHHDAITRERSGASRDPAQGVVDDSFLPRRRRAAEQDPGASDTEEIEAGLALRLEQIAAAIAAVAAGEEGPDGERLLAAFEERRGDIEAFAQRLVPLAQVIDLPGADTPAARASGLDLRTVELPDLPISTVPIPAVHTPDVCSPEPLRPAEVPAPELGR